MSAGFRLCWVCFILVFGCGGASIEAPTPVEQTSPAAEGHSSETSGISQARAPASGQIRRSDLLRVLDQGPARLLGRVVTEPVMDSGKFVGFRIKSFNGDPPLIPALELGDILLALNARQVEKPEQFFAALESLRTAKKLEVAVRRGGQKVLLIHEIVD
jgi:type II secretory pathway component PulC